MKKNPRSQLASLVALALALGMGVPGPVRAQEAAAVPPAEVAPTEAAPPIDAPRDVAPEPTLYAAPAEPLEPESCGERAASIARGAVVRVDSGDAHGTGFLLHDGSHVVTSFRLLRDGHDIRVVDVDGNARVAHVLNTATADDLAMLELAAPLPGAPLAVADAGGLTLGAPVVVMSYGSPLRVHGGPSVAGLAGLRASLGALSAVGDRSVQLDGTPAGATSGAPILDCDGNVLAALSVGFAGFGDPVPLGASRLAIADLEARIDHPEGYGGRVALFFGFGLAMAYEDPGGPMGGYLQLGMTAFDAFVLSGRFHYLMRGDEPLGGDVLSLNNERMRGDAYVAFRQLLTLGEWSMHFELGLGVSVTSVSATLRRATIDDSGMSPVVVTTRESTQRWSVRPMAVANLELGPVVIGYTLELDVDRLHLVHLFDLGGRF